jgi:pimeloyl-ACP methyl ester carboxylesterase
MLWSATLYCLNAFMRAPHNQTSQQLVGQTVRQFTHMAMEPSTVVLPNKPGARLAISTYAPSTPLSGSLSTTLVVFVNGLGMPRASWLSAASQLIASRTQAGKPLPPFLAYDRYGQLGGESEPDPTDAPGTPYGHDLNASVGDLHELLKLEVPKLFGGKGAVDVEKVSLVLVGNSIGTAIARLFAAAYPGTVEALLFLDPMIANTDFVSLYPDPDAADFDQAALEKNGLTVEQLRAARLVTHKMFHPSSPNAEKLDRRTAAALLPYADQPKLPNGPSGMAPVLIVAGHDVETFAMQSEMVRLTPSPEPRIPSMATNLLGWYRRAC